MHLLWRAGLRKRGSSAEPRASRHLGHIVVAAILLSCPAPVAAQEEQPIAPFVVDVRGIFAHHKQQPSVATDLGVAPGNIPTRSIGLSAGLHWYPWHVGKITFGLGGHLLSARGSRMLETDTSSTSSANTSPSPTVQRTFRAIAPDLSFNFGHRNGWSYISGGIGRSLLFLERTDNPLAERIGRKTLHYGAGARWFTNRHIAVSLDLRWYAVSQQPATETTIEQPHTTFLVLSGGIGLR